MSNLKRTLLIGAIWAAIFFVWWLKGFLYQNWNFEIFSFSSWSYLYHEFISGWVISATSDWIFVWTLLLAIPLFVIGWNLFLKVKWKALFKKIWNKIKSFFTPPATVAPQQIKYTKKKSYKKTRPIPLHTTTKSMEKATAKANVEPVSTAPAYASGAAMAGAAGAVAGMSLTASADPLSSSTPVKKETPKSTPSFLDDEDFANIALDDIKIPDRVDLKEDVSGILVKAGYKVIADVSLYGQQVDFIAVDAGKVLLLVSDTQKGDWLADEERFNNEDPLWFSENSHRVSPVFLVMEAAKKLSEKLHKRGETFTIVPVLLERAGNIINAEDMMSTWTKLGAVVCRTGMGGPDELPTAEKGLPKADATATMDMLETVRNAL